MLPALVLTAGLGTRLDPLTRLVAKPAVPLAGRTLIERSLDWLRAQGVRDIVLNLHHRPESITAVVGDGTRLGLHVRYSWEDPILGSAGGPRRALPLFDADPFLIINGDTLCDVDLEPMIQAHERSRAAVTVAVVPNPDPHHYNGIVLDAEQRVAAFVPKGSAGRTWHFVGVQVARREVFGSLDDGVPAETISGIYRDLLMKQPGAVRGWPVTRRFVDVGTPRDYLQTVIEVSHDGRAGARARSAREASTSVIEGDRALVASTARLTRSVVWSGARIGGEVLLDECIVAGEVNVPEGFRRRQSILLPAACLRDGDSVERAGDLIVFPL